MTSGSDSFFCMGNHDLQTLIYLEPGTKIKVQDCVWTIKILWQVYAWLFSCVAQKWKWHLFLGKSIWYQILWKTIVHNYPLRWFLERLLWCQLLLAFWRNIYALNTVVSPFLCMDGLQYNTLVFVQSRGRASSRFWLVSFVKFGFNECYRAKQCVPVKN
jgi:hypothetical protein